MDDEEFEARILMLGFNPVPDYSKTDRAWAHRELLLEILVEAEHPGWMVSRFSDDTWGKKLQPKAAYRKLRRLIKEVTHDPRRV